MRDLLEIVPSKIYPGDNCRDGLPEIKKLAGQIAESGHVSPIQVEIIDGRTTIVAGHRRHAACQMINLWAKEQGKLAMKYGLEADKVPWPTIPCESIDPSIESHILHGMENIARSDLTLYERGGYFRKLRIDHGLSADRVAEIFDLSRQTVDLEMRIHANLAPDCAKRARKWREKGRRSLAEINGLMRRATRRGVSMEQQIEMFEHFDQYGTDGSEPTQKPSGPEPEPELQTPDDLEDFHKELGKLPPGPVKVAARMVSGYMLDPDKASPINRLKNLAKKVGKSR